MKKILLIAGEYPPNIFGGGGIFMHYLSRELVKRGHKVYVIAIDFSEKRIGNLCEDVMVERVNDSMTVVRITIPKHIYPRHKVFQLCSKNVVEKLVEKVNIVHLNTGLYYPFIRRVIQRSKKASVVTIHGDPIINNKISILSLFTSLKDIAYHSTFLLDGVLSLKYETAELYPVFVSKQTVQAISSYIPITKYKIIYNGIDFEFINSNLRRPTLHKHVDFVQKYLEKGYKILVYPARLYPSKNNIFLLYVTKKLFERGHKVKTIFIGEGPLKNKLKNMSKRFRIEQHIIITGRLPYEAVLGIVNSSHVVPFSSLNEACPMAVIEALYIGKPVVAFDLPYVREFMDKGIEGIYVARNSLHFVEVLDSLLSQIDTINENRVGSRIREKIVELFSVKSMTDQYEQLYFDLIR